MVLAVQTLGVEGQVECVGAGPGVSPEAWIRPRPERTELVITGSLAISAGPVPCGQCRCFIEKEQLGPTTRLHQLPVLSFVLQQADDPAPCLIEAPDAARL